MATSMFEPQPSALSLETNLGPPSTQHRTLPGTQGKKTLGSHKGSYQHGVTSLRPAICAERFLQRDRNDQQNVWLCGSTRSIPRVRKYLRLAKTHVGKNGTTAGRRWQRQGPLMVVTTRYATGHASQAAQDKSDSTDLTH
jgi:hypothetical protein